MLTNQSELGDRMIEINLPPAVQPMATLAARLLHERVDLASMGIPVAGDASRRSEAKLHRYLGSCSLCRSDLLGLPWQLTHRQLPHWNCAMTRDTGGGQVGPLQGVVGLLVGLKSEGCWREAIYGVTRFTGAFVRSVCELP